MVDLIEELTPETVAANLDRVRAAIADGGAGGRDPECIEVLAAVKYLPPSAMSALSSGGVTLAGENRAQELVDKQQAAPDGLTWDFIGALQSRKVKEIVGRVRLIHSVASDSVLAQLERHAPAGTEVLVEVNVAGEPGKHGIAPGQLGDFIARCPVRVVGLMTMPPQTSDPQDSRPHFAALAQLASDHGLRHLSMGTSQDYVVATQEGATIVRLGSTLYRSHPAAA